MSDIIYTPPASSAGGTTINPTNNFIPKRQNATTFADSVLENGTNYLYSNYGGYTGLGLDFLNFVSYLGDWNNLINGTSFVVNDASEEIYTKHNGFTNGIAMNFTANSYLFGNIGTGSNITIDANNQYILFNINAAQFGIIDALNSFIEFGNASSLLKLDWANRTSILGDYNGSLNSIYLEINHNNDTIKTFKSGGENGLSFDLIAYTYAFGDISNNNNKSKITINDNIKEITLQTDGGTNIFSQNLIKFDGSVTTPTTTGFSGQHLQVTINGTPYVIRLYNP